MHFRQAAPQQSITELTMHNIIALKELLLCNIHYSLSVSNDPD